MEVIFVGSGGCMRELAWQMLECSSLQKKWEIVGYVDLKKPENDYGVYVGKKLILYLGSDNYFENLHKPVNVVVSIGSSARRKAVVKKLKKNPLLQFPNIILDDIYICKDASIWDSESEGCIISKDCKISTNVTIGNFVFMNIGSIICHDGKIGDFVTLGPDVKLAGNVKIGKNTDIGMGAMVVPGVCVGSDVIVGAGSVVIDNKDDGCKIVGVPAKEVGLKAYSGLNQ